MKSVTERTVNQLSRTGRFLREKEAFQHGHVTVYEHSVHVAELSEKIADRVPIRVDRAALVKGALLHDYFLYDWHERGRGHRLHGFFHPYAALKNAREDYPLSEKEENIILRHMFPLTPVPPMCREAWIVCVADKCCALEETFAGIWEKFRAPVG